MLKVGDSTLLVFVVTPSRYAERDCCTAPAVPLEASIQSMKLSDRVVLKTFFVDTVSVAAVLPVHTACVPGSPAMVAAQATATTTATTTATRKRYRSAIGTPVSAVRRRAGYR
ncbi:MAG: hypothetical protein E6G35_07760 [Actinobacteria bacterium]|nr:MAG: hypothetical protein E6G35_07760 [Actinomycetota bacterium]